MNIAATMSIRTMGISPPLSLTALISAALLLADVVQADMLDTSSMAPWEVCALCHGANGISATAKFPKLAGQKESYLIKQITHFSSGARTNDGGQMQTMVTEVAPEDLSGIASYFAHLPPPSPHAVPTSLKERQQYERGKTLFEKGRPGVAPCASCHADPNSDAPWLDAQHSAYLNKQLVDFANEARGAADSPMNKIAKSLTQDEINAAAIYLQSAQVKRTK